MLISESHNFLFIHLLRTGGTSITRTLTPHAINPDTCLENRLLRALGIRVNHFTIHPRRKFRTHTSAQTAQRYIPRAVWNDLFKFTIVRNPFDRLVSLYTHLTGRRDGKLIGRKYGREFEDLSFGRFAEVISRNPLVFQKQQICDSSGRMLVDHVGHFESLSADFQEILDYLKIDAQLAHVNGSQHRDYRDYYTNELIQLVSERFAEDLEFFGYEFESREPLSVRRMAA